jgi:predicted alpha/beta hydrolase
VQAVSVVVAMALPPPEPPRRAAIPPVVAELDEAAVSPPRPTSTTMRVFAAGAVTGFGSHEQALAGLEWRHGTASVMMSFDHNMSSTIAVGPLAAIDLSRSDLQIAACARRGAFAGCPVLGAGVIGGSATGLLRERSVASQVVFAGVAAMWEHALSGRIALRAHIQADVLMTTTDLEVDHMSVWRSPRFDGAAGLGVIVQFP